MREAAAWLIRALAIGMCAATLVSMGVPFWLPVQIVLLGWCAWAAARMVTRQLWSLLFGASCMLGIAWMGYWAAQGDEISWTLPIVVGAVAYVVFGFKIYDRVRAAR